MPAGMAAMLAQLSDTMESMPERVRSAAAAALDGVARHSAVGAQWSTR